MLGRGEYEGGRSGVSRKTASESRATGRKTARRGADIHVPMPRVYTRIIERQRNGGGVRRRRRGKMPGRDGIGKTARDRWVRDGQGGSAADGRARGGQRELALRSGGKGGVRGATAVRAGERREYR